MLKLIKPGAVFIGELGYWYRIEYVTDTHVDYSIKTNKYSRYLEKKSTTIDMVEYAIKDRRIWPNTKLGKLLYGQT